MKKVRDAIAVVICKDHIVVDSGEIQLIFGCINVIRMACSTVVDKRSEAIPRLKYYEVLQAVIVEIAHGELRIIKAAAPSQCALLTIGIYFDA